MLLQCTKKLLDKLGIVSLSVNNERENIYLWHVNLINVNGEEGVVFVNDETKYSVVLLNLTTFDFGNIEDLFYRGLKDLVKQECIDEDIIKDFIQSSSKIYYSRTKDRSQISTLNKVVELVEHMHSSRLDKGVFQIPLEMKINRLSFKKNKKYIEPRSEMYKYLQNRYDVDIFKIDAYRFKIILDTDEGIISRVVDVPSNAYFHNLHNVIMESFGWEDDHLHEFYFNKIRNPEIIISNDNVLFREEYDDKVKNELEVKLGDFLKKGDSFQYLFDFGDDWLHRIEVIDIVKEYDKNYPTCIMAEGWITDETDIKIINSELKYYYW